MDLDPTAIEPPRRRAEITITVVVDGETRTFTADTTTTGSINTAASKTLRAVADDAGDWLYKRVEV
jgi:hypothetical protein